MSAPEDILRSRCYDGTVIYTPRTDAMSDVTQARIHRETVREHLHANGIARLAPDHFIEEAA